MESDLELESVGFVATRKDSLLHCVRRVVGGREKERITCCKKLG